MAEAVFKYYLITGFARISFVFNVFDMYLLVLILRDHKVMVYNNLLPSKGFIAKRQQGKFQPGNWLKIIRANTNWLDNFPLRTTFSTADTLAKAVRNKLKTRIEY